MQAHNQPVTIKNNKATSSTKINLKKNIYEKKNARHSNHQVRKKNGKNL